MQRHSFIFFVVIAVIAPNALAYEQPTHALISRHALDSSDLADDGELLSALGLKALSQKQLFRDHNGNLKDISALVQEGAVQEDVGARSLSHFYDPIYDRPLTVLGIGWGTKSPDWALEDQRTYSDQSYSLRDANEYLYRALTSTMPQDQNSGFGLLFETLGHVIHHIEDMAQPQHVRNDEHCDRWYCGPFKDPSAYEGFTNDNKKGLPFGGYGAVSFDRAREYWYNGIKGSGSGIAEFTNTNFVTVGTNFVVDDKGNPSSGREYASPTPEGDPENVPVATLYQQLGKPIPADIAAICDYSPDSCAVSFYGNVVRDNLLGTISFNQRAASLSVFDQDLRAVALNVPYPDMEIDTARFFTLNSFNYRAVWPYLIPRAVGYGAGLINYFFRGKLDFKPTDNGDGWTVTNVGQYAIKGDLQVFYDGIDGKRYPVPNAEWKGVQLQPGAEQTLQFDSPEDPPNNTPHQYLIVFKGTIGTEDGVAAKLYKPKPEGPYLYMADSEAAPSALRLYNEDGTPARNLPLLWGTSSYYCCAIAVYNGAVYMTDFQSVAMQQDGVVKGLWDDSQHNYPGITQYPDAVAANTESVYATVGVSDCLPGLPCKEYEDIYRFDHYGNSTGVISHIGTWDYSTGGFAANDRRLCVSDWDDQVGPSTKLLNLNGNEVASLPVGDWEGGPCALTKDRLYYMREYSDAYAEISLTDLNGNIIDSQSLGPIDGDEDGTWDGTAIAADDNYVFIADFDVPRIIVFKRIVNRDAAGNIISEYLLRQPNIKSGSSNWYTKLALDMSKVLHN